MSALDKDVSHFLKSVFTFSCYSGFITVPVPLSYYFTAYFLDSAPATRMESF